MGKPPATRRAARSAEVPHLRAPPNDQLRHAFGFKVLIIVNALAMGAIADISVRLLGLKLPPIFTISWVCGALLLVALGSASARRRLARDAGRVGKPQSGDAAASSGKAPPKSRAA